MRALRKGKEVISEEKSNLLFYIGSIVQTVLGNLKGQNVIVMYHPRQPLMTKVDIYQVRALSKVSVQMPENVKASKNSEIKSELEQKNPNIFGNQC